jgi:ATP-binding cassette subfamily G (WHITE) protein 2 (PDR)
MHTNFRGEAIYTAEVDIHFPQLSVGDTLTFAARARAVSGTILLLNCSSLTVAVTPQPRYPPGGVKVNVFSEHVRDVVMAIFGISHTVNTRVGNDFIRGVSGGE